MVGTGAGVLQIKNRIAYRVLRIAQNRTIKIAKFIVKKLEYS